MKIENLRNGSLVFGYDTDTLKIAMFTVASCTDMVTSKFLTLSRCYDNNQYSVKVPVDSGIGKFFVNDRIFKVALLSNTLIEEYSRDIDLKIEELKELKKNPLLSVD